MTSTEYKTSVGNVFDTACDELGLDLALAMFVSAVRERIERRGYMEADAMRMMRLTNKDTSLIGTT